MRSLPEREVVVGSAGGVEAERVGEAALTSVRRRTCSGGSMFSTIRRMNSRSAGSGSRIWVAPSDEEKSAGVRSTCRTSV